MCTICRDVKLLNFAGGHRGPRGPVANEDTPWLPVKTYLLLIYIYMAQRSNPPRHGHGSAVVLSPSPPCGVVGVWYCPPPPPVVWWGRGTACIYIYIRVCEYMCICVYIYIYIRVCVNICVYVCTYIYIYLDTNMCIYIII